MLIYIYIYKYFVLSSYCYFAFLEKMKGSEWDGGETLQIEIFVLQHFFDQKILEKKCPNIILISSRWSTECFKSDGRKTLQIEIFVLQHFFRKRHWKHMSKYHCNDFEMIHWMSWKRLLKDVAQDETFQFQDELKSFILLSVSFSFFWGLATVVPLWFPVVAPRCAYCREGSPRTFLPPKTGGTSFFHQRARAHWRNSICVPKPWRR